MRLRFFGLVGLCLCGLVPHLVFAQEKVLILQMGDGSFYNPPSGLIAPTRDELLNKLRMSNTTTSVAATSTVPVVTPSSTTPIITDQFPLKQAIERAQSLLEDHLASSTAGTIKSTAKLTVTLAVWHPDTNEIELNELPFSKRSKVLEQEKALSALLPKNDSRLVVAITYPLVKTVRLSKKYSRTTVEYVVYTPYAKALHTPEMVAWGAHVLDTYIETAYAELRQSGVRSRAFPDRLMVDAVDPDLVKAIIMIEHLDPRSLAEKNAIALEPFFVTLAANEEKAYAYARSRVGATGLAQFMPATYQRLARRDDVELVKDFSTGARDAQSAIKAEIVYLDTALADLPSNVRSNEYLAASYNAGSARVRRAVAVWNEAWAESRAQHLQNLKGQAQTNRRTIAELKQKIKKQKSTATIKQLRQQLVTVQTDSRQILAQQNQTRHTSLPLETVYYVKKYRQVAPLIKETRLAIVETSQKQ